jgi:hypothetical protein
MDALSLRQGRLLLPSSSACSQRSPAAALLHRRASPNMRSTGTSRAVHLGRREDARRRCIVSASFFGGGRTTVKKDSNNKVTSTPLKTDSVNCRIFSAEGECTPLELLLSFFGDQGYEVGSPVDLSTFASKKWIENGEELGVTYEGMDGTHPCSKLKSQAAIKQRELASAPTYLHHASSVHLRMYAPRMSVWKPCIHAACACSGRDTAGTSGRPRPQPHMFYSSVHPGMATAPTASQIPIDPFRSASMLMGPGSMGQPAPGGS